MIGVIFLLFRLAVYLVAAGVVLFLYAVAAFTFWDRGEYINVALLTAMVVVAGAISYWVRRRMR